MPNYLIDTNIWSHLQRRTSTQLTQRIGALGMYRLFMSPIVRGELEVGYLKGDKAPQRRLALDTIYGMSMALKIDAAVAARYAQIRTELEQQGTPIGRNDTWIAAEALHHDLVLVTDNTQEFERVKGLKVENWL
jgi:tRNA(fMet)-specific endonuclease VapC